MNVRTCNVYRMFTTKPHKTYYFKMTECHIFIRNTRYRVIGNDCKCLTICILTSLLDSILTGNYSQSKMSNVRITKKH